jgi:hypothetical protein
MKLKSGEDKALKPAREDKQRPPSARVGVTFTEDQKEMIRQIVELETTVTEQSNIADSSHVEAGRDHQKEK